MLPIVTSLGPGLLVVLDEFDLFAHSGKQSLLYTLFDTAQAGSTPLSIVGITSRFDAEDLLEKRVLSRFSRRKVYLHHRLEFPDYVSAFGDCLTLAPFAPYDAECGAWNDAVAEFVKVGRCPHHSNTILCSACLLPGIPPPLVPSCRERARARARKKRKETRERGKLGPQKEKGVHFHLAGLPPVCRRVDCRSRTPSPAMAC